jgi:hypothetical protein
MIPSCTQKIRRIFTQKAEAKSWRGVDQGRAARLDPESLR